MTTYFVTRHQGAIAWADQQGIKVDQQLDHLDIAVVCKGDIVIGTLPIDLAAEVCRIGASYKHLTLKLPLELRGKELPAEQMTALDAKLIEYQIKPIKSIEG